jgi:hypothetical protein
MTGMLDNEPGLVYDLFFNVVFTLLHLHRVISTKDSQATPHVDDIMEETPMSVQKPYSGQHLLHDI